MFRLDRQPIGPHAGRHDDLFERGVAGALADAVDRALDLPGAGADGRERVGDGEAEVVVAMGAEDRAVGVGHPLDDRLEEAGDLVRRRVSDRVGQVDRGRAGIDDGLDDATQEIQVAAGGVFGRELDVVGVAARARDGIDGRSQAGLSRHPEFCRQVQVRRRDERVNAAPRGWCQRLAGAVDVCRRAARQRRDDRVLDGSGDLADGLGIRVGRDREPGLDDVDAKRFELTGQPDLVVHSQGEARRLLAVAQRRVEDDQAIGHRTASLAGGPDQSQGYVS